jgi:predicted dehydrogenase
MPRTRIRWGIAGPGRIADKVAPDFAHVPDAELVAVASRSAARAEAFAERHRIARAYGSYAAIFADPEVDAIYLATPHRQHRDLAIAALRAGKAVLIEKSFTTTVRGAEAVISVARETGRFAMEAMWTRFLPLVAKARALIKDGAIGEVRAVQADLGIERAYDPRDRLFDPSQGGGAMLDLGVYVISFAQMILGTPAKVVAQGTLFPNGVDAEAGLLLDHGDGRRSALLISLRNELPGAARVIGTTGYLDILPRFHHPTDLVLHRKGAAAEPIRMLPLGAGYSHELIEVTECLRAGRSESAIMPLADTLAVQRVMNEACAQLGAFPTEEDDRP